MGLWKTVRGVLAVAAGAATFLVGILAADAVVMFAKGFGADPAGWPAPSNTDLGVAYGHRYVFAALGGVAAAWLVRRRSRWVRHLVVGVTAALVLWAEAMGAMDLHRQFGTPGDLLAKLCAPLPLVVVLAGGLVRPAPARPKPDHAFGVAAEAEAA